MKLNKLEKDSQVDLEFVKLHASEQFEPFEIMRGQAMNTLSLNEQTYADTVNLTPYKYKKLVEKDHRTQLMRL